jgi:opacity protein-like surface antigen
MDIAKFNVGGWNLTLGTTAGFLQTNGNVVAGDILGSLSGQAGLNSTTQAPFIGTYGHATYGNFFFDGIVKADYFQTDLNSPSSNFFNQKIEAHGFTVAGSAGYTWKVPHSSWFIEPSAGVIWSRETVDPISVSSPLFPGFANTLISGTVKLNDLESIIGRAGLRVGTTLETGDIIYSPFVAASVWHDFAGNNTASFTACPGCGGIAPGSGLVANASTNNMGTFGQYSVGVSGQLKNTGWLGFARVDYREGPEVHGLSATGGIRYQFNPTATALPVKAKAPADHPVNWSGWYAGVIGGATELGRASLTFPGVSTAQTRPSGWLGGGTLGYNFQSGRWVYGLEGDIAGTGTAGSTPCAPLVAHQDPITLVPTMPVALFNTTCHDNLDWIATATARLGYAWTPRSMLYIKAGGAFADEKASVTCNYGSPARNTLEATIGSGPCVDPAVTHLLDQASVSAFRAGWTVGIGTEFALTNRWSIKGEFDWLDFGRKTLTLSDGTPFNSKLQVAQGKIGLNYKFWSEEPDSATDLALMPAIKPAFVKAAPAAVSTWDGFYVGGSVGWEQTSSKWNATCFTANGNCGAGNPFFVDASSPHTFDTSGARIGAYFGINWQVAPTWLVGVEADVGFNDKTSQITGIVGCTTSCGAPPHGFQGLIPASDSTSIRTSWDGSLRARAGYLATPGFLVYGTGGFAERMIDANVTCIGLTSPWCKNNESQTYAGHLQAGWTVGGGVEWKVLNNVVLRGEYRYSDYGSWSPTFFSTSVDEMHTKIGSHTHTALFGVSYLFSGTPVR